MFPTSHLQDHSLHSYCNLQWKTHRLQQTQQSMDMLSPNSLPPLSILTTVQTFAMSDRTDSLQIKCKSIYNWHLCSGFPARNLPLPIRVKSVPSQPCRSSIVALCTLSSRGLGYFCKEPKEAIELLNSISKLLMCMWPSSGNTASDINASGCQWPLVFAWLSNRQIWLFHKCC